MLRNLKFLYIPFGLASLLCFARCTKDNTTVDPVNTTHTTNYNVDAGLKTGFGFKQGTYWVYRDSLSGQVDSFYVSGTQDLSTTTTTHGGPGGSDDTYVDVLNYTTIAINEVNIAGTTLEDPASWTMTLTQSVANLDYYTNSTHTVKVATYTPFFIYPFGNAFSSFSADDSVAAPINSPLYALNGNFFENVMEVHRTSASIEKMFVIGPGVGIVKMRINYPALGIHHVWELKRWHIQM